MNPFRMFFGVCCLGLLLALPADFANAQRGGGGDRQAGRDRGEDEGGRGFRGRGRGGDDEGGRRDRRGGDDNGDRRGRGRGDDEGDRRRPSEEDRQQWFIRRLDRNGDGRIERSEVDDRMWGFFERSAEQAGLDVSGGVTVNQYLQARQMQQRREFRSENPTAFLAPLEPEKAPGFDTPLTQTELIMLNPDKERPFQATEVAATESTSNSRTSGRSGRFSRESGGESSNDRTERYASSLMERYDKNGNSILEREEWQEMRGDPERNDLNKDGRITRDELVKRFSNFGNNNDDDDEASSRRSGREGSGERESRFGRRSRDSRDSDDRDAGDDVRKTYRFTSALDRLPRDARSWVERYDKNEDGQVAMAEFTKSWTDSKVREFFGYDLNRDGMVTGDEYLQSKER